jgi:predicted Rossmann-fold nucleotide-binding protein
MEAAARGAAERGGESIGVVLAGGGEPNRFITRRQTASDLSERLRLLRDLPGAWIFLPKGLGTLLEILWVAESITKKWVEARPMVFLGDFWRAAVETALREAAGRGAGALRGAVRWTADPAAAVEAALGPLEM